MIEIYVHSCVTCGLLGARIAKVKRHHPDAKVIDTRKDDAMLGRHVFFLKQSGMETGEYTAIVVEENGQRIVRLDEWKNDRY